MRDLPNLHPLASRNKETIIEHKERVELAKKNHRLAVANKGPRIFFDKDRASNGRAQVLQHLARARVSLGYASNYWLDYSADDGMLKAIRKARIYIRQLSQNIRGPNDATDYGED